MLKNKDRENLKSSERITPLYKGIPVGLMAEFSSEIRGQKTEG